MEAKEYVEKRNTILVLILLFLLSVCIRMPTLNRPLSKHHEFCTAVALRIMQVWDEAGIASCHFNPVMTYPHPADKFINNYASGSGKMMDERGNYYYISHPPLAYYLPFFLFRIFGIAPGVLPVEVFNLFIHFLCSIGVFLILQFLSYGPAILPVSLRKLSPLLAFSAYLFSPGTLWFHSNVYMADILVQLFFIYGVYFALRFGEEKKREWLLLSGITVFLMTYTTWLGVFYCAAVIALAIWKKDIAQTIFIAGCTASALILTAFQYSRIAGCDALMQEWLFRFSERSGWHSPDMLNSLAVILKNYLTSYLPVIAAIFLMLIFFFRESKGLLQGKPGRFIFLSAAPVILLHLLLSDYSGHDFTTLYGGLFLCVMFGALAHGAAQRIKPRWTAMGTLTVIIACVIQYYYINRPGKYSLNGDRYADFQDIGKSIARQSSNEEVIFLKGRKPSPEIILYAGRNILRIHDETEAVNFLQERGLKRGLIFHVTDGNRAVVEKKLNYSFQH